MLPYAEMHTLLLFVEVCHFFPLKSSKFQGRDYVRISSTCKQHLVLLVMWLRRMASYLRIGHTSCGHFFCFIYLLNKKITVES